MEEKAKTPIPIAEKRTLRVYRGTPTSLLDTIAIEAPFEMKVVLLENQQKKQLPLAITMRTPGADRDLAFGYLFTEGIIGKEEDVIGWHQLGNTVHIELASNILKESITTNERHTIAHASCGICGKPSLESIEKTSCYYPIPHSPMIPYQLITQLPTQLLIEQTSFTQTGGMHAAALFEPGGAMLQLTEDIGRHNALDKLIGWAVQQSLIPLRQQILLLSGRISFELVQKASLAGIPIIAAVGAPSTLAVELAEAVGITLIGFVKEDRFNVYCGAERILFEL